MSRHAKSAMTTFHHSVIEWMQALVYVFAKSAHRSNVDVFDLPGLKILTPRYALLTRTRTMSGWTYTRTWSSGRLAAFRASRDRAKRKFAYLVTSGNVDFRGNRLVSRPGLAAPL